MNRQLKDGVGSETAGGRWARIQPGRDWSAGRRPFYPQQQARHIATVRKNSLEEIRIELGEFNGHDLLSVRVWAEPRGSGTDRIPTKAGIACNVKLLPELIEALQQAEMAARKAGLLGSGS